MSQAHRNCKREIRHKCDFLPRPAVVVETRVSYSPPASRLQRSVLHVFIQGLASGLILCWCRLAYLYLSSCTYTPVDVLHFPFDVHIAFRCKPDVARLTSAIPSACILLAETGQVVSVYGLLLAAAVRQL